MTIQGRGVGSTGSTAFDRCWFDGFYGFYRFPVRMVSGERSDANDGRSVPGGGKRTIEP